MTFSLGSFITLSPLQSEAKSEQQITVTDEFLNSAFTTKTESLYSQQIITETEVIPFETTITEDPEMEYNTTVIDQIGQNGEITNTYNLSLYENIETEKTLISQEKILPQNEIVRKGTKIIPHTLTTPDGEIIYAYSLHVYATAYTAESAGGSGYTASGTLPHYGTIAVDPNLIPLGTKVYIPGYGIAVAEDTGGAIKGEVIDLFYEGNHGWWNASYVDIYILY